jgi:hypothetical protein
VAFRNIFPLRNKEIADILSFSDLKPRDTVTAKRGGETQVLLPLEVMVHPLELRFKYHFSGTKPTNRLDKVRIFSSFQV